MIMGSEVSVTSPVPVAHVTGRASAKFAEGSRFDSRSFTFQSSRGPSVGRRPSINLSCAYSIVSSVFWVVVAGASVTGHTMSHAAHTASAACDSKAQKTTSPPRPKMGGWERVGKMVTRLSGASYRGWMDQDGPAAFTR